MNRGFFRFPVLVIERLNVYVSLIQKRKMKKFVLFVMLMMSVVSVSAQRWSLTPEVGMTAVKRGGSSYIVGKSELEWSMLLNRTVFH